MMILMSIMAYVICIYSYIAFCRLPARLLRSTTASANHNPLITAASMSLILIPKVRKHRQLQYLFDAIYYACIPPCSSLVCSACGPRRHPAFSATNPECCRAVFGGFAGSAPNFHAADGSGYRFMADSVLEVHLNPKS